MKKFIFGFIAIVLILIAVGTFWHLDLRKEHGYGNYQKELAKRDQRINELEDTIRNMQESLSFYRGAVMWFIGLDDKELEKNVDLFRSVPPSMIP